MKKINTSVTNLKIPTDLNDSGARKKLKLGYKYLSIVIIFIALLGVLDTLSPQPPPPAEEKNLKKNDTIHPLLKIYRFYDTTLKKEFVEIIAGKDFHHGNSIRIPGNEFKEGIEFFQEGLLPEKKELFFSINDENHNWMQLKNTDTWLKYKVEIAVFPKKYAPFLITCSYRNAILAPNDNSSFVTNFKLGGKTKKN